MIISRPLRSAICMALVCTWGAAAPLSHAENPQGPLPAEMKTWDDATRQQQREAGVKLLGFLNDAVKRGEKEIRAPKGDYRFQKNTGGKHPTHIVFGKEFAGVTLDFQGSTLWFETEASGVVLSGASKATIRNVILDWDPLPFIQGTVTSISPETNTLTVKLDPGYDRAVPGLMTDTWRGRGIVFDPKTRELKSEQGGCEVTFSWSAKEPDDSYRLKYHSFSKGGKVEQGGISVGDPYVMLRRMQRAVRIEGCTGAVLEDVTLYAAPFIGYVNAGGSNTTFRHCNILRRPGTNRLMAGNADGINCSDMAKGPTIEGCRMETIGDDFVNIHSYLSRVLTQENPTTVVVSRLNRRGNLGGTVTVEFLDRKTMRSFGKRQVTAEPIANWKVEKQNTLADLSHKWHAGDASGLAYGKPTAAHRLTLDKPIEIKGYAIAICEAYSSANSVIRNCDFKGSLARGLRLQSPHVLVENNKIATTLGAGLTLVGHAAFWGEGPYVYDATVRNNTFTETGIGSGSKGKRATVIVEEGDYRNSQLNYDIRIDGNRFIRSGGPAIVMRGADSSSIVGNEIDGFCMLPQRPDPAKELQAGMTSAIVAEACKNLKLENNKAANPGPHASGDPVVTVDVTKAK